MAENLLNHGSLSDEAYDFHWLAAVRANEGGDLKDASHQKCPHYRGFTVRFATIRFTIRPAILVLVLFEVEWGVGACCDASCVGVDFAAIGVDFAAIGGCRLGGLVGPIGGLVGPIGGLVGRIGRIGLIEFVCSHAELFAQPHLFGGAVETDGQGGIWAGSAGHQGAPFAVWGKNSGIGMTMAAGWRDQSGQAVQKLHGGQLDVIASPKISPSPKRCGACSPNDPTPTSSG
jgi:hypothetical protein